MNEFWASVVTIAVAIIGVAFLAVIVAPGAQTSSVIRAATGGLATDLQAATAPVTGGGGAGFLNNSFPAVGAGYLG